MKPKLKLQLIYLFSQHLNQTQISNINSLDIVKKSFSSEIYFEIGFCIYQIVTPNEFQKFTQQLKIIDILLEAQLLYNKIDVTDSLTDVQLFRPYLRFVDRFGRSLWFSYFSFSCELDVFELFETKCFFSRTKSSYISI